MNSNYEILISKINKFTRKFYLNKLLRGLIYTFAVLLALYLLSFVFVYYLHPSPLIKTVLFFSCLFFLLVLFIILVISPALSYFKLHKSLSLEESAALIGDHFFPVRDKLLNALQLKALADSSPQHNKLILAGIDQKIEALKLVPFSMAIRLRDNRKYLKYVLSPLLIIIVVGLIAPAMLKEGTRSFVQYDKEILPAAPFQFRLLNSTMVVTQGDDLTLSLKLEGNELPQQVYLKEGSNSFKLEKENTSTFSYTFTNLQKSLSFKISGGGFDSKTYQVIVKPRPAVLHLQAKLIYPAYLKKKNEIISNAGDLLLPEGTTVNWHIFTENAAALSFKLGEKTTSLSVKNNTAAYSAAIKKDLHYQVAPSSNLAMHTDTISHEIRVIADQPPTIVVTEKADSLSNKARYFTGELTDDHGFSALKFVYFLQSEGTKTKKISTAIPFNAAAVQSAFFYYWNLQNILLKPGQIITYYIEVTDNDAVNGPKTTRSALKTFSAPTPHQLSAKLETESNTLKQQMDAAIKLAAQVEKESKKIREKFLDKNSLSFEDKKEISQLLEKQKKLEEAVGKIQQAKKKNTQENEAIKQDLAEKQKKIDDLFNHVLDPKTKDLLKKLQDLMDSKNKDQVQNELSKMSMDHKTLKNELDRILELYKQLEFEQNLQDKVTRLKDLAKSQKELSTKSKNTPLAEIKKIQEKQNQDFNEIKKEIKDLDDKNQRLEHPNAFNSPEKEMQPIENQQQEILNNLQKKQVEKAASLQKKTAEDLERIAEKLEKEMQESEEMESNLNSGALRKLLQNLLKTSFDQEKLMLVLKKTALSDPQYNNQVLQQKQIRDNMKTIADSLSALSKKIPQIESTVTEEIQQINFNMDKSLENMAERQRSEAGKNQQYVMSSINNLALMLNEALEQLERNKKNSKQGGKGKSKGSMQQLQKMQQQLNKSMEQAKQQLEKQGNKGQAPKGMMTEEFAKMAQQQQLIREALQKLNREENKDGKGSLGNLNELVEEMKLTESDLINKKLEQETIKRQQGLMTKLLDADQASREQDQDSKRESKAGRELPASYQQHYQEFKKKQSAGQELLQKLPPAMNYYYKNKITDYFKLLNLQQ